MAHGDYEMARKYLERIANQAVDRLWDGINLSPLIMRQYTKAQEILDRTLPPKDDQDSSSS